MATLQLYFLPNHLRKDEEIPQIYLPVPIKVVFGIVARLSSSHSEEQGEVKEIIEIDNTIPVEVRS